MLRFKLVVIFVVGILLFGNTTYATSKYEYGQFKCPDTYSSEAENQYTESPNLFAGIKYNDSMLVALQKINNVADSYLNLYSYSLYDKKKFTPYNIKNKVSKAEITNELNRIFRQNVAMANTYRYRENVNMPQGTKKFFTHELDFKAGTVYICNIPFNINMTFKYNPLIYYTKPSECFILSDGSIVSYYLSYITLNVCDSTEKYSSAHFDTSPIIDLFQSKYPAENYENGSYQPGWGYDIYTDKVRIEIRTGNGSIKYSNVYNFLTEKEDYDYFIQSQIKNDYQYKKDSSNQI